ncbi:MAG: helix-turn-helix domain-containing protein [Selenomonadaceae bacterium]|nr:helix-turn-helix domain-containing protein [Selenomonadaceae bacterium]
MHIMQLSKTLLHVSDVASLLNCSSQKIYNLIKTNQLTAYKDAGGKAWKVPVSAVEAYVNSRVTQLSHLT